MKANGFIDMTGRKCGRLIVLGRARHQRISAGRKAAWECRCSCGRRVIVIGYTLRSGATRSCGCLRDDTARLRLLKHGACRSREYLAWAAAKTRCYNAKQPLYKNYGGRGITMCRRWRRSFEAFREDMGPCPPRHSLDRINVDGKYGPRNCRWATRGEQQNNTRANHTITFRGKRHTIADWERLLKFGEGVLKRRLLRGWPIERAMTTAPTPFHLLTLRGETKQLNAWARGFGIHANTVKGRLNRGWPVDDALTTPVGAPRPVRE